MSKVRTRFAPSPTGSLHIGGVRTALYAYALARKHGGEYDVRIEDTDQSRLVEGSEQELLATLINYGLEHDAVFKQSERLDLYKKFAEQLIEQGDAYYCFASAEEIKKSRELAEQNKQHFKFVSPYRDMDPQEAKAKVDSGAKYVIRQRIPRGETVEFEDAIQGKMQFETDELDDTVLLKSDGFPTYHLAVVVDDHDMEISHVFRGVEWIPSIPKHVLLYKSFGWEIPVHAHLPVILDPDGGKLSKRKGTVSAEGFLKEGYLPEAMLNFLMLQGWSAPMERVHGEREREVFSLTDFVEMFELKDINKSSGIFNRDKLIWFNHQYISAMSLDELSNRFTTWLDEYADAPQLEKQIIEKGPDFLQEIIKLEQSRIKLLSELPDRMALFYQRGEKQDLTTIKQLKKVDAKTLDLFLSDFLEIINKHEEDLSDWSHEAWEADVRNLATSYKIKAGEGFMALRIAVTDTTISPPLYETMQLFGKDETVSRIKRYLT